MFFCLQDGTPLALPGSTSQPTENMSDDTLVLPEEAVKPPPTFLPEEQIQPPDTRPASPLVNTDETLSATKTAKLENDFVPHFEIESEKPKSWLPVAGGVAGIALVGALIFGVWWSIQPGPNEFALAETNIKNNSGTGNSFEDSNGLLTDSASEGVIRADNSQRKMLDDSGGDNDSRSAEEKPAIKTAKILPTKNEEPLPAYPTNLKSGNEPPPVITQSDQKNRETVTRTPAEERSPAKSEPPPSPATPTKRPKTIAKGVLNGSAVSLPKPAYPAGARAVRASGTVNVQVLIDENGNVISAKAVSGHPLLRSSAEKAARRARFRSTLLSGQPVKVTGVLVYNFKP